MAAPVKALTYTSKVELSKNVDSGAALRICTMAKRRANTSVGPGVLPNVRRTAIAARKIFYFAVPRLLNQGVLTRKRIVLLAIYRGTLALRAPGIRRTTTFPAPYLPKGTTRPNNGTQWPRLATFGSIQG